MKLLKNNKEVILGLLLGILLTGSTVYANNLSFTAKEIAYDNTESGLTKTNVQDAMDELCEKSKSCKQIRENVTYFKFGEPNTSSTTDYTQVGHKVFVAKNGDQKSACVIRFGVLHCFDSGNFLIEREHMKQVYSDIECDDDAFALDCYASDTRCFLNAGGGAYCDDKETQEHCMVYSDEKVECAHA